MKNKIIGAIALACCSLTPLVADHQKDMHTHQKSAQMQNQEDDCMFYAHGDFLYWVVRGQALEFIQSNARPFFEGGAVVTPESNATLLPGNTFNPYPTTISKSFHPGFKVGLGIVTNYDKWDLGSTYTRLHTNTQTAVITPGDKVLIEMFNSNAFVESGLGGIFPGDLRIASSQVWWKLNYETINLMLGRMYSPSKTVSIMPRVGFMGSWQKQTVNIRADVETTSTTTPTDLEGSFYLVNNEDKYWGVGPAVSMESTWKIVDEFSLFASLETSLLWSMYEVSRVDTETLVEEGVTTFENTQQFNCRHKGHDITPYLGSSIGLQWHQKFDDSKFNFILRGAWEYQLWFNQNKAIDVGSAVRLGNLGLQGFTLRLVLAY